MTMPNLIRFIRQHPDIIIHKVSADAVYIAAHAVESDGSLSSELSPALRSFQAVREWLGY